MNVNDKRNVFSLLQKEAVLVAFRISRLRRLKKLGPWKLMENFLIIVLHRNLDSVTILLRNLDLRFSFIGITKTWLQDSSHYTVISGYNFVHNPRKDKAGGDVGLYLADNFDFKCRPDLVFFLH